ncbi:MAG: hypothetical protein ACKOYM_01340 [Actinomycetes bacterium]
MSSNGYVVLAWVVTFLVVGLYALWVVRRGRTLTGQVPPDQRRWMTAKDRDRD